MEFDKEKMPEHIAIIMDGNRRWAKSKGKNAGAGHKEGAKTIEKIVRYGNKIGLKYITVYAFSTENWKRAEEEVSGLMLLLKTYLDDYSKRADTENIKVNVIGDISAFKDDIQKSINRCMERTKNNTGIMFNIALNYGGKAELVRAMKNIAIDIKNEKIRVEDINEKMISDNLYLNNIPDPDLIIRTSNELRLSGFLMWQSAYSELYFMEKNWPDFNEDDLDNAILEYQKRNRRFGGN
jgi:undecaprenyl diphosphate synthase